VQGLEEQFGDKRKQREKDTEELLEDLYNKLENRKLQMTG